ncbi:MAG: hypothetical protein WC390_08600 [Sulfurimonas sp.]|jgi:hypothetical protein
MALTQSFVLGPMAGFASYPLITVPEGASQTFKAGDLLVASSGLAVVGGADPTAGTIIGIATCDGSNTTAGTLIEVIPALPGLIFSGQIQNAAATATLVYATHMFAEFGINVTSNKWWIDTDETTHKDVIIVSFQDAVGTLNGIVNFMFKPLGTIYGTAIT